jgi:histidinol-phosphate phosphatase family protein
VFLDRDGTLIDDPGFLTDPARVRALPGAVRAVARLTRAGFLPIIVTNQSGIGRGLISEDQYHAVRDRVETVLSGDGGRIAASLHCPHASTVTGQCGCRKPGTDLYREAAHRFDLDLTRCWWVGDRLTDVEPARTLGGRAVLLVGLDDALVAAAEASGFETAPDIRAATDAILADQVEHD